MNPEELRSIIRDELRIFGEQLKTKVNFSFALPARSESELLPNAAESSDPLPPKKTGDC